MPDWKVEPLVNELKAMKKRMDTLYQRSCGGQQGTRAGNEPVYSWHPQVDILETREAWLFLADLPGVPEEELSVEVVDHRLRISGNRPLPAEISAKPGGKVKTLKSERGHGAFSRTLDIPGDAEEEAVQAELKLGVLKIVVPKQHSSRTGEHKITVHSL